MSARSCTGARAEPVTRDHDRGVRGLDGPPVRAHRGDRESGFLEGLLAFGRGDDYFLKTARFGFIGGRCALGACRLACQP